MSTDIYIPLAVVLSHPGQFTIKPALNGCIEDAAEIFKAEEGHNIDWEAVDSELQPVLLCKFGNRETWRFVSVFDHDLHISVGGSFRMWLISWLEDHNHPFEHI